MNTTHVYILFYSYVGVNSILVYNEFGVAFTWLYFLVELQSANIAVCIICVHTSTYKRLLHAN